jgi:deoxyribodipyrimidine photolyase
MRPAKHARPAAAPAVVWLRQDLCLSRSYPRPIVSLGVSRETALEAYQSIRQKSGSVCR